VGVVRQRTGYIYQVNSVENQIATGARIKEMANEINRTIRDWEKVKVT